MDANRIGFAVDALSDRALHGINERTATIGIATVVFLAQSRINIANFYGRGSVGGNGEKQQVARRYEGGFDTSETRGLVLFRTGPRSISSRACKPSSRDTARALSTSMAWRCP